MRVEYIGGGMYKGTIPYENSQSCIYHSDRQQLTADLIEQAFGEKEEQETGRAWTDKDYEEDFVAREIEHKHKYD